MLEDAVVVFVMARNVVLEKNEDRFRRLNFNSFPDGGGATAKTASDTFDLVLVVQVYSIPVLPTTYRNHKGLHVAGTIPVS